MTTDVGVPVTSHGGNVTGTPTPPVWTVHGDITQIAGPWVQALGELEEISRTRTANAGTYSYTYADLGDVLSTTRPVLAKHDLALFQVPQIVDNDVAMTTVVMHTSGTFYEFAPFILPAGATAQSTGSAATYARRYSITSILGLATEDNDGATAGTRAQKGSQPTLSPGNVSRFLEAATEALLTPDETAQVVKEATNGRTDNPAEVWVSEVAALRDALHAAAQSDAGEQASPASRSGEGEVADISPDQPPEPTRPDPSLTEKRPRE